ncbi:MAG: energy transducer TonB [Thermoanaerobaculia bacterium]
MSLAVDRILERRSRRESRRPEVVSLAAAAALHGIALVLVLVLPRLNPPPPPLSFVPVQIIPAQALGVRRPAPRPKADKPVPPKPEPAEEPEPPAPEPPKPKPKPEPERPTPKPVKEEVPALPEKPEKKKPEPKPEKPRPAATGTGNNPAGTAQQGDANGEPGRRGAPTGNPLGTTAFGSQIAGLDNPDFKFGLYIERLLSAIDSQWMRPPLGNDVKAIISFRIQRDGSIDALQVTQSSGYNSFDLAALRAVQNASPFAPLPRGYRNDSLGVTLIVR